MTYTSSDVSSQVMGIAGTGISIGMLAHMAKNLSHMTDDLYAPRHRHIKRNNTPKHRHRPYKIPYRRY